MKLFLTKMLEWTIGAVVVMAVLCLAAWTDTDSVKTPPESAYQV